MKLWPFDKNFFLLFLLMLVFGVIVFFIPASSHTLIDLIVKVGLVIVLNFIIVFKTNWVTGVKAMLDKLLRKLGV